MNLKEKPHRTLTTGGAGHIGAYITHLLKKSDCPVIVFDNLNTGNACTISDALYPHLLPTSHACKKQSSGSSYLWGNASIRRMFA